MQPRLGELRDRAAHGGPADEAGALQALQALRGEFPADLLERSGVARADADGTWRLNPVVAEPGSVLLALRADDEAPPFELLTCRGGLRGETFPIPAVLEDAATRRMLPEFDDQLCAAFSIADVVALRAAGVPATLATGLEALTSRGFTEVLHRAPPRAGGADPPDEDWTLRLVLVGWSPSEPSVERPEALEPVLAHFRQLERHLEVRMDDVSVWCPGDQDLEALRFRVQYGSVDDVRGGLLESAAHGAGVEKREGRDAAVYGPPLEYAAAVALLHEVGRGDDRQLHARAWEKFQEALVRDVVDPLLREAKLVHDPHRRDLMLAHAEVSRLFHTHAVALAADLARRPSGLNEKETRKLASLVDKLAKSSTEARASSSGGRGDSGDTRSSDVPASP